MEQPLIVVGLMRLWIVAGALLCAGGASLAETLATDCIPPLRPDLAPSPALLRDYGDEIRAEFDTYFDQAQTYLNCLAAASADAQAEVRLVLDAYQEIFNE